MADAETLIPAIAASGARLSPPVNGRPRRLGELLVADEVITQRQLDAALEQQRTGMPRRRLGQVLIEQRITSEQRIHDTVKRHATEYQIGELMVLLDLITPEQLEECLAHQKANAGKRIGQIALDKEYVAERDLLLTLSYHFDLPFIDPDVNLIDPSLLSKLSVPYLRRMEALPIFTDGRVVTVVTPDPSRMDLAPAFAASLGLPVELAIAPRNAILQISTISSTCTARARKTARLMTAPSRSWITCCQGPSGTRRATCTSNRCTTGFACATASMANSFTKRICRCTTGRELPAASR
jgi:hypothetical protein